jgi:hypothetical protein
MATMSSTYKNPFKKQDLDTSEKSFPSLQSNDTDAKLENPSWPRSNMNRISDSAKRYPNGDIFDGYYDEKGEPIYGKLTFANGNVYEGPIQSSWDKTADQDDWIDEPMDYYDSYYDDFSADDRVGVFTTPEGKTFYGIFCFGNKSRC